MCIIYKVMTSQTRVNIYSPTHKYPPIAWASFSGSQQNNNTSNIILICTYWDVIKELNKWNLKIQCRQKSNHKSQTYLAKMNYQWLSKIILYVTKSHVILIYMLFLLKQQTTVFLMRKNQILFIYSITIECALW